MKSCVVCSKDSAYKCPKCSALYCSASCCKQHKIECSSSVVNSDPTISCLIRNGRDISTSSPDPTVNYKVNASCSDAPDTKNGLNLLSIDQKRKIESSVWLRDILKSKRLKKHILDVDEASDRHLALKLLCNSNEEFKDFVTKLADEISS